MTARLPTAGPEPAAPPLGVTSRAAAYALVLVLAVLLALWGSFLVPFRVGSTLVPVCWVVAAVGNAGLGAAGGRLAGRAGAVVPGAVWFAVAFSLGTKRAEGDLIVPGNATGLGFLLAGAVGSVVAYLLHVTRRAAVED